MFKPSPQLCARLRFTTKDVGRGFYRGNRTGSMGSHTEFGGYVVDWRKTPHYNAPSAQDFSLTPFVTLEMERTTRVQDRPDGTTYTPEKVDGVEFLRQWARLNPPEYETVVDHQTAEREAQLEWSTIPQEQRARLEAEQEEQRRQEIAADEARQLEIVMENAQRRKVQEEEDRRLQAEAKRERQLQAQQEQLRLQAEEEERRTQAEEERRNRLAANQRLRSELKRIRDSAREEAERTLTAEGRRRKDEGLPPMKKALRRMIRAQLFVTMVRQAGLEVELRSRSDEEQRQLLAREEIEALNTTAESSLAREARKLAH
ncbi:hypothetical protein A1O1_08849 [Capronia coronata CBS 617.96]|uniref:Uncharacterized protein n=1 Tax=Capronia coronata CBS 617.96 TaxID=1182541 RepID=W9Y7T2_9EURO|nr:uncharacterized protein A1O1_08849 [Capronia coronata CBS 617.96]EXJ78449.1 hypothetical protein A1O1_08849 [Capronia coronata CBS 617.96]